MSKALLEALMKIFAIVMNVDEVNNAERDKLRAALGNILNEKLVQYYMEFFESEVEKISQQNDFDEKEQIIKLCDSLNKELTRHQKIAMLLQLTSIMIADGEISEGELGVARIICEQFKVETSDYETLMRFVIGRSPGQLDSKDVLIVDNNNYNGRNQFHHISRNLTDGFIAILNVPHSGSYFIKTMGQNEVFLNGMPLKESHLRPFAAGSSLRGKFDPLYYSDVVTNFKDAENFDRLSLEVRHMGYKFKNGHIGLRDINFSENSGRLLGIMGASGSGKSTLLNVLNGTDHPTSGEVLVNGVNIHESPDIIEGVIGFIPQDDLLLDELTVYQNLYYAAKLCFSILDETEIEKLVSKTLTNLGLAEIKDLKVGSPLEKVISGGQRKRVNIALELIREPSILFVDEPTSGLSSRDSENIMDLLKELSLNGKIVFVVIHQPSSQIFKMFDKLLVLDTGGYQIYYGNPVESVTYFKEASKLVGSDEGECVVCGNVNPEQVFDIIEAKIVDEYGWVTKHRKVSPKKWAGEYQNTTQPAPIKISTEKPKSSLNQPSALNQFNIFGMRDIRSKLANRQYVLINLLEAPVLAAILAFIVRYSSGEEYIFGSNENIPSYLFMSIIVALFMGLTVSAEELIKDRKILKRESFLNLSRGSYLSSKLTILFGISAIQTLMFVLVGNAILEIKGMYLIFWAILFTTSAFANLLGLTISSAMNSVVTVYILIPFLLIPQLLLSGVVVKFDQLNNLLRNEINVPIIGDLMVSRWMLEAALVEQFTNNSFEKIYYPYDKIIADTRFNSVYYIPALVSKIKVVQGQLNGVNVTPQDDFADNIALLEVELNKQLTIVGKRQLPQIAQFTPELIDNAALTAANIFLAELKSFNNIKQTKAIAQKDSVTSQLIKLGQFDQLKQSEYNEYITRLVTNSLSVGRITQHNGELKRLIDPVFMTDCQPGGPLDYRTPLYVPVKQFLGLTYSTTTFNLLVVWFMTGLMMIALYNDWLGRLVRRFSRP